MSVTTLEGIVKNGNIVLPEGSLLPESAKVYILVTDDLQNRPRIMSPRLADKTKLGDFELEVTDIPDDEV
jgi:hypothetical protein